RCSVKATTELPDDPALPALAAIRALGLAAAIPGLGLDDRPVELTLRGYTPGSRATLEVRAGDRHFALKLYAEDPAPEAELYEALAAVGLGLVRSEEHTSELQSLAYLVCRLLLEKKISQDLRVTQYHMLKHAILIMVDL